MKNLLEPWEVFFLLFFPLNYPTIPRCYPSYMFKGQTPRNFLSCCTAAMFDVPRLSLFSSNYNDTRNIIRVTCCWDDGEMNLCQPYVQILLMSAAGSTWEEGDGCPYEYERPHMLETYCLIFWYRESRDQAYYYFDYTMRRGVYRATGSFLDEWTRESGGNSVLLFREWRMSSFSTRRTAVQANLNLLWRVNVQPTRSSQKMSSSNFSSRSNNPVTSLLSISFSLF